ncbi:hypothetical protein BC941DRAFT_453252 [Chlamydoabsidia padenii]|nr:hypothetical protein BC941DRAFT_453252 [Chlamydoabsidia padenii]
MCTASTGVQFSAYKGTKTTGNVNTPRPGLFDMVGRAKWDAWKKLEGVNKLEAQHLYVETLLQAVSEAYQKPASKTQAQQIIQAFASMRQVGDGDTTDDELTTTTTEDDNNEDEDYPPPPPPQQQQQQYRTDSRSTNHTNVSSVQMLPSPIMGGGRLRTLQSPFHGSSAASSVTATMSNVRPLQQRRQQQQQQDPSTQPSQDYAYASIVSLGPATKRALESLQAEVIALNDRIDDLRHELLRRDRQSVATQPSTDDGEGADDWEGWRWVINAAIKYAAVNVLTAFIILVILYKRGSPAAYAVVGKLTKLFYKIRGRLRVTTVVV